MTPPEVGSRWVWEIDKPDAICVVEVLEAWWNGEEWWVRTETLLPNPTLPDWHSRIAVNELSRFAEAASPVGDLAVVEG